MTRFLRRYVNQSPNFYFAVRWYTATQSLATRGKTPPCSPIWTIRVGRTYSPKPSAGSALDLSLDYRTPAQVFQGDQTVRDEKSKERSCSPEPVLLSYTRTMAPSLNFALILSN